MSEQADKYTNLVLGLLATYGMNVLGAIITLVVGFVIAGWLARLTDRAMSRSTRIDPVFHPLPAKVVRIAIMVITVIAVLNRFGVETTSLIALLGAAGLAIGLALQGTLSNVASGVMILSFRPFKIGDAIKVGGDVYIIDQLGFFVTKAHLPDGPVAWLPNSKIWGQTLVNYSVTDKDMRRIDETYGIAYTDNIDTALQILRQVAADEPRVLDDPEPFIKVQALGDSSVDILFRVWTKRGDWWGAKLDLVKQCKESLEAGGITIPFPQRDVNLTLLQGGGNGGAADGNDGGADGDAGAGAAGASAKTA